MLFKDLPLVSINNLIEWALHGGKVKNSSEHKALVFGGGSHKSESKNRVKRD